MKILAFIMACIILALSCMPCMDGTYDMNMGKTNTAISQSHNLTGDNCTDNCSPFCACNCCPGFVFTFETIKIDHINISAAEILAAYLPINISAIALPVWQPPQLG